MLSNYKLGLGALLLSSIFSASLIITDHEQNLDAFGCRPGLIPNGNINRCLNCHESASGGDARNAFGIAIEELEVGCSDFWGPELAMLDSDGDGRTNGEELGDPEGTWKRGDEAPGDPEEVTRPGDPTFNRGDSDANGLLEVTDPILNLTFQFLGGVEIKCMDTLDFDDNGKIELTDPIANLSHQFLGTQAPMPPNNGTCGEDPTPERRGEVLDCLEYPSSSCIMDS